MRAKYLIRAAAVIAFVGLFVATLQWVLYVPEGYITVGSFADRLYVAIPVALILVWGAAAVVGILWAVALGLLQVIDRLIHREEYARLDAVDEALLEVSPAWFLDALGAPENTDDDALVRMVADMPEGTEYALVRAHRKGVKADDVAPLIATGSFTEADADRLAREVA